MNEIRDIALAPSGETKIAWVRRNMPVLRGIEADFARAKPFAGMKIALSVHLEAKTAYLCRVLAAGGAEMYVTGSNPLSTQDDVAAALAAGGHGSPRRLRRERGGVLRPHQERPRPRAQHHNRRRRRPAGDHAHRLPRAVQGRHRRLRGDHQRHTPHTQAGQGRPAPLHDGRGQRRRLQAPL